MRDLYEPELRTVLDWFLYHMSQEQRGQLMGDLPRHYAQLFPGVDQDALCAKVKLRIEEISKQSHVLGGARRGY